MELPGVVSNDARQKLKEVRGTLLNLHKALLDSERAAYELVYGNVLSPAAFLQLLINDPAFAWLRPVTTLVVQIDEALAAKNPPKTERDFSQLLEDTRALLSPSRQVDEFWKHYQSALQRDPGVAVLHDQMEKQLT